MYFFYNSSVTLHVDTLIDTPTAVCFLGNVQAVPMIFVKEENCEPQRNIVLESNCRDKNKDVFASSSTIKKALESSTAIKCIDSPRSSKEIFNENCFSYNTLTSANPMEKDQSLTTYEIVLHDHNYKNTPQNVKENLDNLKRKLVSIVKENKALKQRVRRLSKRVETFIGCGKRPETKKIFTRFCVILLSAHEDASLKLFNRMLRNKNSRGKFTRDKYPPCSLVFSAVEFCK